MECFPTVIQSKSVIKTYVPLTSKEEKIIFVWYTNSQTFRTTVEFIINFFSFTMSVFEDLYTTIEKKKKTNNSLGLYLKKVYFPTSKHNLKHYFQEFTI